MAGAGAGDTPPVWHYTGMEHGTEVQDAAKLASSNIDLSPHQEFTVFCLTSVPGQDVIQHECKLMVDLGNYSVQLNDKTIRKIRYIALNKDETLGYVVVLSWSDLSWEGTESPSIEFLFFQFSEKDRILHSVNLINAVRRLLFESVASICKIDSLEEAKKVVDFNRLLLMGDLQCTVQDLSETTYFTIMDRECLGLFESKFGERPTRKLLFWKDPGPNVLEQATMMHGNKTIKMESDNLKIQIPSTDSEIVRDFTNALRYAVNSKPRIIYQDYKELYSHLRTNPDRVGFGQPGKDYRGPEKRPPLPDWKGPTASSLSIGPGPHNTWRGYDRQEWEGAGGVAEATQYKDELDNAESRCKNMAVYEEMIVPMWIAAEDEMKSLIDNSFIPRSEFDSGGFDPDNFDHLLKCMQDAEEKLMEQNYDLALSRVLGARKTFSESSNLVIREIFEDSDLTLLKKIFHRNFSMSQ